jgi:ribosomal-protein-serine acetyltransferase
MRQSPHSEPGEKGMIPRDIELTDGAIVLRAPELRDAEGIYAAVRESIPEIKPWMSWCHKGYTIDETREWLASLPNGWQDDSNYAFVITEATGGRILGGCGLNHINRFFRLANLGYWVRSSSTGQGIAGRATRLVARFGFEQLRLVRVEIVVGVGNQRSLRVAVKAGATQEGVLRNRLIIGQELQAAVMHSLIPEDFGLVAQVGLMKQPAEKGTD